MLAPCHACRMAAHNENGEAPLSKHLPAGCLLGLVVELESELDLPRVVRRIASRADQSEVGVGVICRSTDSYNSVTAKAWRVEVRMVEDVEDFRPELQPIPFLKHKILKDRKVQPVETRARNLSQTSQRIVASERYAAGGFAGPQHARLREGRRITEPTQVLSVRERYIMQTKLQRLAREQNAASKALCGSLRTAQTDRLSVLERRNPHELPTTNHLIGKPAGVGEETLSFAER